MEEKEYVKQKVERFLLQQRLTSRMDNCPECDGKMYDDGEEIACKVCGFVVEEKK